MHRLNTRYEALRQEIRRVFTTALPDQQTIVSEKAQLQDAVAALQSRQRLMTGAAASPLELLRQLSSTLPEQVNLDLDEWTLDDESVRLRGTTTSFDAAETIKTAAAGLGVFREVQLKDVKTTAGGKKVSFALQMLFPQEKQ
jgi:general secretion pathway protein L